MLSDADAVRRIRVLPLDGPWVLVVQPEVLLDAARQILHREKDAAMDEIALNFGKPEFDLIQPRRVGGREMQMQPRMLRHKGLDLFRLVRREIVADDVDLLPS